MKQIKVVLAGLGFGACFLPIYLDHPNVHSVGILDTNEEKLNRMKEDYPQVQLYSSLEEYLADMERLAGDREAVRINDDGTVTLSF